MLKYAFISEVAVILANWYGKSNSQSTDMTPASHIQCHMYMTSLTLKLKVSEKSNLRLRIWGLRHGKICIQICGSINAGQLTWEKHFTKYRYTANS